eukprot:760085-Hanusia_phi.AAC.1
MGDGDVQDQAHPMGGRVRATEGGGCRQFSTWSECCECPADATSPSCPRPQGYSEEIPQGARYSAQGPFNGYSAQG